MRKLLLILAVLLLFCGCSPLERRPDTTVARKEAAPQIATTTEPEEDKIDITKRFLLSATDNYDCKISVYEADDGLQIFVSVGKTANTWVFYDVTNNVTETCKMFISQYGYQIKELNVSSGTSDETMLIWRTTDLETGVMSDSMNDKIYKMTFEELKEYLGFSPSQGG